MRPALCTLCLALSAPTLPANEDAARKPNLVIIMADDLGYGELGCYGNQAYKTPHLDALARAGLRFTDYHSNGAVCSPTRAALLTGRYQQRAGVGGVIFAGFNQNRNHGLHQGETTFAELLAAASANGTLATTKSSTPSITASPGSAATSAAISTTSPTTTGSESTTGGKDWSTSGRKGIQPT